MANYDNDNNNKGKFSIVAIVCAVLYLIFNHFFGYSETMTCTENHCDIYKVKNSNKVPHLYKSFDEKDVVGYDVIRSGNKNDENTTYIPIVILNDGSKIRLNTLETSNYTEANHTTFISIRNKKFPR